MTFVPTMDEPPDGAKPLAKRVPSQAASSLAPELATPAETRSAVDERHRSDGAQGMDPDPTREADRFLRHRPRQPGRSADHGAARVQSIDPGSVQSPTFDRTAELAMSGETRPSSSDPIAQAALDAPNPNVINSLLERVSEGHLPSVQQTARPYQPETAAPTGANKVRPVARRTPTTSSNSGAVVSDRRPAETPSSHRDSTAAETSWPVIEERSDFDRTPGACLDTTELHEPFARETPPQTPQDRPERHNVDVPRSAVKVRTPFSGSTGSDDSSVDIDDSLLISLAYRIVYRLLGSHSHAQGVAHHAVQYADRISPDNWPKDLQLAGAAVESALEWREKNGPILAQLTVIDPHASHRTRLARDLRRWTNDERAILALRALADWDVDRIVDTLDAKEAGVRQVTSVWFPDDSDSVGMLRSLNQWTGGHPIDAPAFIDAGPLSHLDDVHVMATSSP